MTDEELMTKMATVLESYMFWSSDDGDTGNNDDVCDVLREYKAHIADKEESRRLDEAVRQRMFEMMRTYYEDVGHPANLVTNAAKVRVIETMIGLVFPDAPQ